MPKPMSFAVAGYGAWGRFHARSIAEAPDGRLVAIAAPSDDNARAAKSDFPDATVHRQWETLIDDPAVEAIAVATPNHLHAPIAVAALAAGKHVLLEKPMANSLPDCDRIVAAATHAKAQLSVGLQCRLSPQWGRIRSLIDEGAIGQPRHVHVSLFRHPYRQGSGGWRYDKARVGSWILEEPVHFFDLALWYLVHSGRPVKVQALGAGQAGMQPMISVLMQFPDGATAAINQVLAGFEHHQTVEVVGDAGAVRATWSAATARSLEFGDHTSPQTRWRRWLCGLAGCAIRRGLRARKAGAGLNRRVSFRQVLGLGRGGTRGRCRVSGRGGFRRPRRPADYGGLADVTC